VQGRLAGQCGIQATGQAGTVWLQQGLWQGWRGRQDPRAIQGEEGKGLAPSSILRVRERKEVPGTHTGSVSTGLPASLRRSAKSQISSAEVL